MPMPESVKEQFIESITAGLVAGGDLSYEAGFQAGVASVPSGGGFTQEQVDQAVLDAKLALKQAVKDVIDAHDGDIETDPQLKDKVDALS